MNKVLIVALVVIAVLFAIGIAAATSHDDDTERPEDTEGSLIDDLKDVFLGETENVEADDVLGSCRQGGVIDLPLGGSCSVRVRDNGSYVRDLNLQVFGGTVAVSFAQKDHITIPEKSLAVGESMTYQVFENGGTLFVQCVLACSLGILSS